MTAIVIVLIVAGVANAVMLGLAIRRLDRWEADLSAREAALESARAARQDMLVAIAVERMELEKVRGRVAFPVPGARA